jgi:predicted transcriptional regulator of viral defense system
MVEAGDLIALGSGLYAHASLDPFTASLIATARYYPKAVISNITALVIHDLSDERVDRIDVDIPRSSSIRNKLIHTHRVAAENIMGVMRLNYQGHKLKIYCRERALCDAYRIDPDGPLFLKAMKRYVKLGEVDPDRIAKYDKALSINVLRSLRQELADE